MSKTCAFFFLRAFLLVTWQSFALQKISYNSILKKNFEKYRIQPSNELPLLNLIEHPDKKYDPLKTELDTRQLYGALGNHYDLNFMSDKKPLDAILEPNGTLEYGFSMNRRGLPIKDHPFKLISFKFNVFGHKRKTRLRVGRRVKKKIRRYLTSYTACPVLFRWRDIGIRFWPRYIKEGQCFNSPKKSCSIPPGMACKPKRTKKLIILRWHCSDWNSRSGCRWIPVEFPVIANCKCTC